MLLGGALTEVFGWPAVFFAALPLAAAVLAAAPALLPADPPRGGGTPIDVPGALTVTGGLIAVTYALAAGGRDGWTSVRAAGPLAAGIALLAAFWWIERRGAAPLVPPRVLRVATVRSANLAMIFLGAAWIGLFYYLPLYQQKVLGYGPLLAGLTQLPLAAALTSASAVAPRLTRRWGRRTSLVAALTVLAGGLCWPAAGTAAQAGFAGGLLGPSVLIVTTGHHERKPMSEPYVSGHFAPVADEHTASALRVRGALPPELNGRYFRNGHNPKPGVTPTHWFRGSGMIHGLRLRDGRAEWYRNRWVRTPAFEHDAPLVRGDGTLDLTASVAGTHVIEHAGRFLALQEANLPFEVTGELETVGAFDFGGKLTTATTAHPKQDPVTGEPHFFAYSPARPHLIYYTASPAGDLVRADVVEGAGPSLKHDFAITENHVVWLDLPVVFDPAETSGVPYRWSDDYAPRIGIMPRTGAPDVTLYDVEPGALLHVSNAFEDAADRIVLDGPRYDRASWETAWKWWIGAAGHPPTPVVGAIGTRWTFDPSTGRAAEEIRDDLVTEFPSINDDRLGRGNRYGYAVAFPGAGLTGHALVKYDSVTGARQVRTVGPHVLPGEAVFVPAAGGTAEDDGYLLTITSDTARDASELLVLDATDLTREPVAVVELPRRVPAGIHGSWIPEPADAPRP